MTTTVSLASAVLAALDGAGITAAGAIAAADANDWGGFDVHVGGLDRGLLRVLPIDSAFENGAVVLVMAGRGQIVQARAEVTGMGPRGIAQIAATLVAEAGN